MKTRYTLIKLANKGLALLLFLVFIAASPGLAQAETIKHTLTLEFIHNVGSGDVKLENIGGDSGTYSSGNSFTVNEGLNVTVTFMPDAGHFIEYYEITGAGIEESFIFPPPEQSKSFIMLGDRTIRVKFTKHIEDANEFIAALANVEYTTMSLTGDIGQATEVLVVNGDVIIVSDEEFTERKLDNFTIFNKADNVTYRDIKFTNDATVHVGTHSPTVKTASVIFLNVEWGDETDIFVADGSTLTTTGTPPPKAAKKDIHVAGELYDEGVLIPTVTVLTGPVLADDAQDVEFTGAGIDFTKFRIYGVGDGEKGALIELILPEAGPTWHSGLTLAGTATETWKATKQDPKTLHLTYFDTEPIGQSDDFIINNAVHAKGLPHGAYTVEVVAVGGVTNTFDLTVEKYVVTNEAEFLEALGKEINPIFLGDDIGLATDVTTITYDVTIDGQNNKFSEPGLATLTFKTDDGFIKDLEWEADVTVWVPDGNKLTLIGTVTPTGGLYVAGELFDEGDNVAIEVGNRTVTAAVDRDLELEITLDGFSVYEGAEFVLELPTPGPEWNDDTEIGFIYNNGNGQFNVTGDNKILTLTVTGNLDPDDFPGTFTLTKAINANGVALDDYTVDVTAVGGITTTFTLTVDEFLVLNQADFLAALAGKVNPILLAADIGLSTDITTITYPVTIDGSDTYKFESDNAAIYTMTFSSDVVSVKSVTFTDNGFLFVDNETSFTNVGIKSNVFVTISSTADFNNVSWDDEAQIFVDKNGVLTLEGTVAPPVKDLIVAGQLFDNSDDLDASITVGTSTVTVQTPDPHELVLHDIDLDKFLIADGAHLVFELPTPGPTWNSDYNAIGFITDTFTAISVEGGNKTLTITFDGDTPVGEIGTLTMTNAINTDGVSQGYYAVKVTAVGGITNTFDLWVEDLAYVMNLAELETALEITDIDIIVLGAHIPIPDGLTITRTVTIDGQGEYNFVKSLSVKGSSPVELAINENVTFKDTGWDEQVVVKVKKDKTLTFEGTIDNPADNYDTPGDPSTGLTGTPSENSFLQMIGALGWDVGTVTFTNEIRVTTPTWSDDPDHELLTRQSKTDFHFKAFADNFSLLKDAVVVIEIKEGRGKFYDVDAWQALPSIQSAAILDEALTADKIRIRLDDLNAGEPGNAIDWHITDGFKTTGVEAGPIEFFGTIAGVPFSYTVEAKDPEVVVTIDQDFDIICGPGVVTFTADLDPKVETPTFTWSVIDHPDGVDQSDFPGTDTNVFVIEPTVPGHYVIQVEVEDAYDVTGTATASLTVNPLPEVDDDILEFADEPVYWNKTNTFTVTMVETASYTFSYEIERPDGSVYTPTYATTDFSGKVSDTFTFDPIAPQALGIGAHTMELTISYNVTGCEDVFIHEFVVVRPEAYARFVPSYQMEGGVRTITYDVALDEITVTFETSAKGSIGVGTSPFTLGVRTETTTVDQPAGDFTPVSCTWTQDGNTFTIQPVNESEEPVPFLINHYYRLDFKDITYNDQPVEWSLARTFDTGPGFDPTDTEAYYKGQHVIFKTIEAPGFIGQVKFFSGYRDGDLYAPINALLPVDDFEIKFNSQLVTTNENDFEANPNDLHIGTNTVTIEIKNNAPDWDDWRASGVGAGDALIIQRMRINQDINRPWIGSPPYPVFAEAIADIEGKGGPTTPGARALLRRSVGLSAPEFKAPVMQAGGSYLQEAGGFPAGVHNDPFELYDPPNIRFVHTGGDTYEAAFEIEDFEMIDYTGDGIGVQRFDIYFILTGDMRARHIWGTKTSASDNSLKLNYIEPITAENGQDIQIPVMVDAHAGISAFDLGFTYNAGQLEITGAEGPDGMVYHITPDAILMAWASTNTIAIEAGETLVTVNATIRGDISASDRFFELASNCELVDEDASTITGVDLNINALSAGMPTDIAAADNNEVRITNYPNPFDSQTTIEYVLPENAAVTLVVYNQMGQAVKTLVDERQNAGIYQVLFDRAAHNAGIYFYRITVEGSESTYNRTNSMVIMH